MSVISKKAIHLPPLAVEFCNPNGSAEFSEA
jgi:hypothetical protein